MKHLRIMKGLMTSLVALVALLFLAFSLLLSTVYISYSNGSLQRWLSQQLDLSINFEISGITWLGGYPAIKFKNIVVMAKDRPLPTLRIDQGLVELDILQSLWHLKPVSNDVILRGLHARFIQTPDGHYLLQGTDAPSTSSSGVEWSDVWAWLRLQQNIEFSDSFISLRRADNTALNLTTVNMAWHQLSDEHYGMDLSFLLPEAEGGFRITANFAGDLGKGEKFKADFHGELEGSDLASLLDEVGWRGLVLNSGSGSIEWWGAWQYGELARLQVRTDLTHLAIHNAQTQSNLLIPNLAEDILWQLESNDSWNLVSKPWKQNTDNDYFALTARPSAQGRQYSLQFASLSLPLLSHMVQMLPEIPSNIQNILLQTSPDGSVSDGYLNATIANDQLNDYLADFKINNFSLKAWQKLPALQGLNASLHMTKNWGQLVISADHFKVDARPTFAGAWPSTSVNADIRWLRDHDRLEVQLANLQLINPWINVTTAGRYEGNLQALSQGNLRLLAGIDAKHLEKILYAYLPEEYMPKKLAWWLSHGIISAPSVTSTLVLNGPIGNWPFKDSSGRFEILANAKEATIMPWMLWPNISNIDGQILFSNHQFFAALSSGDLLGAKVKEASISVNDMTYNAPADFVIEGQVVGTGEEATQLVLRSPLNKSLGTLVRALQVHGPLDLALKLTFPLGKTGEHKHILGDLTYRNDTVNIADLPIAADSLAGSIHFTEDTVESQNLSADLLGELVKINIFTSEKPNSLPKKVIEISTILNATKFAEELPNPWSTSLSGLVPVNFTFTSVGEDQALALNSDLTALAVNLPSPLTKQTLTPLTLNLDAKTDADNLPIIVKLGNIFRANIVMQNKNAQLQFLHGVIALGEGSYTMPDQGLLVLGEIPYFSLSEWIDYCKQIEINAHSKASALGALSNANLWQYLSSVKLNIAKLDVYQQIFNNLQLTLSTEKNNLKVGLDSAEIKGNVLLPYNGQSLQADLDYWYVNRDAGADSDSNHVMSAKDLSAIPSLNIIVKRLFIGKNLLGGLSLNTKPTSDGIEISNLNLSNDNVVINLSGSVGHENQQDIVNVKVDIDANNFGAALAQIGYTKVMSGGIGPVNTSLSWQGSLFKPDLQSMIGELDFDLTKGSLSEVNPGISRLIGLLNINSWLRRVELNFSDVTDRGLAFDSMKGHFSIVNGVVSTDNASLSGPALVLNMQGSMDLVAESLNESIVVIPQVGGGLALAAGIIGGPVVGVATWLADSVISNTLLKGKGIEYQVTGSFKKPEFNAVQ